MLVLTRKLNQSVVVDENITITIVDIKKDQISIGISAPPSVKIYRSELLEAIRQENITSRDTADDSLLAEISRKIKPPRQKEKGI